MTYSTQTTYSPKRTNHVLHLLLTMGTCGAWGFVWIAVALYNAVTKEKHRTVAQGWYGPVPRPYEVGPGAPVGPMNPHPPTPGVPTPPMPGYVGVPSGYPHAGSGTRPPGLMPGYCAHGQPTSLYCEQCGNDELDEGIPPARFPQ